jgi:hypothetical protein
MPPTTAGAAQRMALTVAVLVVTSFGRMAEARAVHVLPVSADTYVRSGTHADQSFGSRPALRVKESPDPAGDFDRETWLKFDTRAFAGRVIDAKLRLYGSLQGHTRVHVSIYSSANSSWDETSLSWNTRPPVAAEREATTVVSRHRAWNEWDVTALLDRERASGRYFVTFVLRADAPTRAAGVFHSKEQSNRRPALRLAVIPAERSFVTLPPGSPLPSSAECAARVRQNDWEPRPQNEPENSVTGGSGHRPTLPDDVFIGFDSWRRLYADRVRGDFTGQTDELIQWASCKWGFDEDTTRAVAVNESFWSQEQLGDGGQSVGILQVKSRDPGTDGPGGPHHYTFPDSRDSTAYNLDYALAWRRACYEGYFAEGGWLPPTSRGDFDGCVGLWFSGDWHVGDEEYVASYRRHLREKPWTTWPGWPGR